MRQIFRRRKNETLKIAYFLNMFPALSERFITNEVIGLRERGVTIDTYALGRPAKGMENAELKILIDSTYYILSSIRVKKIVSAHFYFFLRYPRRYLKTFLFAFRHRNRAESLIGTLWQLAVSKKELSKPQRQNPVLQFLLIAMVAQRMDGRHYQLLHSQFADSATSLAMLASMLLKIPFSFTAHAYDIFTPQVMFSEKLARALFIITCTQYNRNYLLENHPQLHPTKIHVNLHGIRISLFRRQQRRPIGPPLIISVGRLVAKKGMGLLVHACKLLKERSVAFRCRIVGDGPERPRLEMQIRLNQLLDHVEITGLLQPAQVKEQYEAARLFVLPCIVDEEGNRDGIPNVIAEAMAMQVPVISTAISGIPELVQDGVSGVLLEQADAEKLADTIMTMLASPKRMSRLAKAGRRRVEQIFDNRTTLDELKDIFISRCA
ncbi:glycosyltransferase [candidate division KSB1 bacterium]|nr:glycosyltransferase [candidate division KSB1 bacterium]